MNGMQSILCGVALIIKFVVPTLLVTAVAADETVDQKYVVSIERIWDRPAHAAFTDIIAQSGHLYCTFREGSAHIPGLNGVIRVIRSRDGMNWESMAVLAEPHVDLRDPKLAITPDGLLMINMGASSYHGEKRLGIESRVAFSESDGTTFGPPLKVEFPKDTISGADWLWRITWHEGVAWGCVQHLHSGPVGDDRRALRLVRSRDAIHFEEVAQLDVDSPSETTLRFLPDQTMVAMIRCEGTPPIGRIGTAKPPYTDWKFVDANKRFGGPNFVQLPGGDWLAGSRAYDSGPPKTQLWWLDLDSGKCRDLLTFPSGGDNSYPGFVVDAGKRRVYVSYYSSHEGKAAIYLATLRLDALESQRPH
ncbi:MAG: sialidase family protein [Pirellulales bacterium]